LRVPDRARSQQGLGVDGKLRDRFYVTRNYL